MFPELPDYPEAIEEFLLNCKAGDERRHGYYRALRCFYRFLHRRLNTPNPVELVDPPRRKPKDPYWLTPEELDRLLNFPHEPPVEAALLFLADTGARSGELVNLKREDIRQTSWGYTAIVNGKTGAREVPLSYETYCALIKTVPFEYSEYRLRKWIPQAFRNAGVKGTAINLRHTFGTLWEGDELILQRIMGHATLSTTKNYRHLRTKIISEQHYKYSPLKMIRSRTKEMSMI